MSGEMSTTWLILTDAESRYMRRVVEAVSDPEALAIYNRAIIRGAERMQADFTERMKAKKAGGK